MLARLLKNDLVRDVLKFLLFAKQDYSSSSSFVLAGERRREKEKKQELS